MRVSLIVAVAENGVIGKDGNLPWHIPGDLKWFKETTMGKPMIMGRKTWESFGKPLPGRPHIVMTRDANYKAAGATVCQNLEEALEAASGMLDETGEVMIIGGGEIYRMALPSVDRLYLTEVALSPEGDTRFPSFDRNDWVELSRGTVEPRDNVPEYSFTILDKV